MAETYEVDFAVNITPKIKNDDVKGADQYYMDDEIAKSLGGSGVSGGIDGTSFATGADDVAGWAAGVPTYINSSHASAGSRTITGASHAMGVIKNTGHRFDTSAVLGAAISKTANAWTANDCITLTFGGSTAVVCTLYPGESMVLPRWSAGACVITDAGDGIAVEYALIK